MNDEKRKINKEAIMSIICSVISLFIFWWLAFVGIGLGIRALSSIKRNNEKGITLVIISFICAIISAVLFFSQMLFR